MIDYTSQEPIKGKANIKLLIKYSKMVNIAEELDDELLEKIGRKVVKEAEDDDKTREEWFDKYNEALKIAKQTIEKKSYPFENAANVKIPLILQGCIQFNARLLPEIVRNNKTVSVSIIGSSTEEDEQRAKRISEHMTLQTIKTVENWVGDTDKLLMTLPLIGTVFRKWCYDPILRKPATYLCLPTEVIINNDITSISQAQRITHVLKMTKNEIIEKMRYGLYKEVELYQLEESINENSREDAEKILPTTMDDSTYNYMVYEQWRYYDLDEDGYEEPYIVTVLKHNHKVLRISAAFDEASFIYNYKNELIKIIPHRYYSAHHFLPSPDGTFLGVGFGSLLLQLNAAINSIVNNLIDAGTLANIRGGFISRDLRLQKGDANFAPGEYKQVNSPMGQNIANSIYPLPISEPSQTLFVLLQFLVDFGRQVANISDVLMGNASNANMPATSVVTLVEQGTKIFNSILMRLYESLKQEYAILYDLNRRYLPLYAKSDLMVSDGFITEEDYASDKYNILPIANPSMGMDAVRLAKLQVLMGMIQDPELNSHEIKRRYFDALGIGDIDKLFRTPEELAQPTAQDLILKAELENKQADSALKSMQQHKIMMEHEAEAVKTEIEEKRIQVDAAYKGGLLAIEKAKASAEIALKEAQIGTMGVQKVEQASDLIDEEMIKTDIQPDFTDINQQIGLTGGGVQGSMQTPSGQPTTGREAPQEGGGEIPQELVQQLQQIAQEQQGGVPTGEPGQ